MPRTPSRTKRRPLLEARTTVSLEREAYDTLAEIAYDRRVSIGCVVREAVANYLVSQAADASKSARHGKPQAAKAKRGRP